MVSPTFLGEAVWLVGSGTAAFEPFYGRTRDQVVAENAALRSSQNLTTPPQPSDVANRPTPDTFLSPGDKAGGFGFGDTAVLRETGGHNPPVHPSSRGDKRYGVIRLSSLLR
jgi:hypothetical protein